jgi:inhibitor of cysteine peptidase
MFLKLGFWEERMNAKRNFTVRRQPRRMLIILGGVALSAGLLLGASGLPLGRTAIACGAYGLAEKPAEVEKKKVTVTAENNGKEVTVNQGEVVEVRLEANPSTGYEWEIIQNDAEILTPLGDPKFELPAPTEPPIVGAPTMQIFQFSAAKAGKANLKLEYRRPWDKESKPLDSFAVTVIVK